MTGDDEEARELLRRLAASGPDLAIARDLHDVAVRLGVRQRANPVWLRLRPVDGPGLRPMLILPGGRARRCPTAGPFQSVTFDADGVLYRGRTTSFLRMDEILVEPRDGAFARPGTDGGETRWSSGLHISGVAPAGRAPRLARAVAGGKLEYARQLLRLLEDAADNEKNPSRLPSAPPVSVRIGMSRPSSRESYGGFRSVEVDWTASDPPRIVVVSTGMAETLGLLHRTEAGGFYGWDVKVAGWTGAAGRIEVSTEEPDVRVGR